jgi:hypothetical protein
VLKDINISVVPINMETIIEPNNSFDFSKLSLSLPTGIQGGAYFTKIEFNSKPLYIQTSKSLTKQGLVKSGKKYYCDLMFDKNSETIIHWFENLEDKCQKLIIEKKDTWFQNNLEENDIESAFSSLIRVYKSGKYYLVRANIKNSRNDEPMVKIYNENKVSLNITDVTSETNIISILEIQGIKFTSRIFQIEIELKQIMVLDNEKIFDNCLIKTNKIEESSFITPLEKMETKRIHDESISKTEPYESSNQLSVENNINEHINQHIKEVPLLDMKNNLESIDIELNNKIENTMKENNEEIIDLEIEDLNKDIEENIDELNEVNLNLNLEDLESIQLKKPNQVYFELYKQARNKAKEAKKHAILAYLEAKNIKKTYMLENMDDSDSDFDAEIDEVSESELEGL